jgi:hypothetical protein
MRKWTILLVAMVVMCPAAVLAGVQGSLHDIDEYKAANSLPAGATKGGACAYCHIPHGAKGEKLYKDQITVTVPKRWVTTDQPVSLICGTCHAISSDSPIVSGKQSDWMFNDNSHRDNVSVLLSWGDNSVYQMKASTSRALLECTSCHDIHDAGVAPFLNTFTTKVQGDTHSNCVKCHPNRANDGGLVGTANHIQWTAGNTNLFGSGNTTGYASQHPTKIAMAAQPGGDDESAMTVPSGDVIGAAPSGTRTANSSVWRSNAKYNSGGTNVIGCQSCHAVHGVEGSAGTGTPVFNNQPSYGGRAFYGITILAAARTNATNSAFCQVCHASTVTGTGAGNHPVNTASANWKVTVDRSGTSPINNWTWGTSADEIVCESCHDVHYGSDNSAILRRAVANAQIDNAAATSYVGVQFCNACHANSPAKKVTFAYGNHHPVSYLKDGATVLEIIQDPANAAVNMWRDDTSGNVYHATAAQLTWNTITDTAPNMSDYRTGFTASPANAYKFGLLEATKKVMVCGTCHGNSGSGAIQAHVTSPAGMLYPLDTNTESEMCVDCHTANPSIYIKRYEGRTSSFLDCNVMTHFVGKIGKDYKGHQTGNPWPASITNYATVPSEYSTDGGGLGSIICESCHYWKSGNYNYTNLNAVGHDNALVQNVVYGMIAQGGNNFESTDNNVYMCSGCHGNSPGGGSSHPTLPGNNLTSAAVATLVGTQSDPFQGKGTLTANNRVNCDSCHRPHNATAGSGAVIVEGGFTTSPISSKPLFQLAADNGTGNNMFLNQEGVCVRCHSQGR